MPLFDARVLGYGFDAAQTFLGALSPKGLALYLGPMRALDTVFPILLALVLSLGIWLYLARRAAIIFGLVAFVAAWLDLQENSAVSDMLNIGADAITTDLVERASTLTMAKWTSYLVALCALIFGIIQRRRA